MARAESVHGGGPERSGDGVRLSSRAIAMVVLLLCSYVSLAYLQPDLAHGQTAYEVQISPTSDRAGGSPLDGAVVAGDMYVFTSPDTDVDRVTFYLDDPDRSGAPFRVENNAPYDFNGGELTAATPYDSSLLDDGFHDITVEIELDDGSSEVVNASFEVDNSAPALSFDVTGLEASFSDGDPPITWTVTVTSSDGAVVPVTVTSDEPWATVDPGSGDSPLSIDVTADPGALPSSTGSAIIRASAPGYLDATLPVTVFEDYALLFSEFPDRSAAETLAGAVVAGDIHVFTGPDDDVDRVDFYIDDPTLSGPPFRVENAAPYDLVGADSSGLANPYDSSDLIDGEHSITADMLLDDGSTRVVSATFTVANSIPALVFAPNSVLVTVSEGEAAPDQLVTVDTSDGAVATITLSSDQPWLTLSPDDGDTALDVTGSIDTTGLTPGTYVATATATAAGYVDGTVDFTLEVSGPPQLEVSQGSMALLAELGSDTSAIDVVLSGSDGGTASFTAVSDETWVVVTPDTGSTPETLSVDIDTASLAVGSHAATVSITAPGYIAVDLPITVEIVEGVTLQYSLDSDRSDPVPLAGAVVVGDIHVFTGPDTDVDRVLFYLDDPLFTGPPAKVENNAPYDFAGGLSGGLAAPWDTTEVGDGLHDISARVTFDDGSTQDLAAAFTVSNIAPALLFSPGTVSITIAEGDGVAGQVLTVDTSDGSVATVSLSADQTWLTLDPEDGDTSLDVTASIDSSGFTPATYTATVTASAAGYVDGTAEVVIEVTGPPALEVNPGSVDVLAELGTATPAVDVPLSATDASAASFTIVSDQTWATVNPDTGATPETVSVDIDTASLGVGTHAATLTCTAPGYLPVDLPVNVEIVEGVTLQYSVSSDRSSPLGLSGAVLAGDVYIFTAPEGDLDRVDFYLDDPGMTGAPTKIENTAPFDFSGGAGAGLAAPYDTSDIADGAHTITADLLFNDGSTQVITSAFTVANSIPALLFSPDILSITIAEGESVADQAFTVDTSDGSVATVALSSDQAWLTLGPDSGDTSLATTAGIDATGFTPGDYTATITASAAGYSDGTAEVTIEVTGPPEIEASPGSIDVLAESGSSTAAVDLGLTTSDGEVADYTVVSDQTWVTITPETGSTPATVSVDIDSGGLSVGSHLATLTVTAPGYVEVEVPVSVEIFEGVTLRYSLTSDRASPLPLSGAVVNGDIYAFTGPDTDVDRVDFYLDDPTRSGPAFKIENNAPYDFAGGAFGGLANPYDTNAIADGSHTITAEMLFDDGSTQDVNATFTVTNTLPALTFATSIITVVVVEGDAAPDQDLSVDTSDGTTATIVLSSDETWLTLTPEDGDTPLDVTAAIDTTGFTQGSFTATVVATAPGYLDGSADVVVQVTGPPGLEIDPSSISLSEELGSSTPVTSVDVTMSDASVVTYTAASDETWASVNPDNGSTPDAVSVDIDSASLAIGNHTATITFTAPTHDPVDLVINVGITEGVSLLYSTTSDRSSPLVLANAVVTDDIYVFTNPDDDVDLVEFYLDDPLFLGAPENIENNGPFDFKGGAFGGLALPFDTTDVSDGLHNVSARVLFDDGSSQDISASFSVVNSGPPPAPPLVVDTLVDEVDGACDDGDCSLRDALALVAAAPEVTDIDFDVTGTIALIIGSLEMTGDGTRILGSDRDVILDGSALVGEPVLVLSADSCTVVGMKVQGATSGAPGILITGSDNVIGGLLTEQSNWVTANDGAGVEIFGALAMDNQLIGNCIGNPDDDGEPGNTAGGVLIDRAVFSSVGSPVAAGRNQIVGNETDAVIILGVDMALTIDASPALVSVAKGGTTSFAVTIDTDDLSGTLFEAYPDRPWITVPALPDPTPATVTLDVDAAGLEAGVHTASVEFRAAGYLPVTLGIELEVLAPALLAAGFAPSVTSGLAPITVDFIDASTGTVDTRSWDFGDGSPLDASISPTHTFDLPGTYVVTHTVNGPDGSDTARQQIRVLPVIGPGLEYFAGDDVAETAVSIDGERFCINGVITYAGQEWEGHPVEGLLLNSRMVNGVYDDLDGDPPNSMLPWDARLNTEDYIAAMPAWREQGLLAFTIFMQGGSNRCNDLFGDDQSLEVQNNPFGATGSACFDDWDAGVDSPNSQYLSRLGSVIRAADDLGMVVILGLFYFGQDELIDDLPDDAGIHAAVDGTVDWVLANGWTNVIIEVVNESDPGSYDHPSLFPGDLPDLLVRVKDQSSVPRGAYLPRGRLLVTASLRGGELPLNSWIEDSDLVLLHGNSQTAQAVSDMIQSVRDRATWQADPKPIVFNEDSTNMDNMRAAVQGGASWGFFDNNGYQCVYSPSNTARWTLAQTTEPEFWPLLARMSGVSGQRADSNRLQGNELDPCTGLAVDLAGDGAGNPATGPNDGIAAPTFTLISTGRIEGTTVPGALVEVYRAVEPGVDDTLVAVASHTADSVGVILLPLSGVAIGDVLCGTATDARGNTSELSAPVEVLVDAPRHILMFSTNPLRTGGVEVGGTVSGNIYVFAAPEQGIDRVEFFLDTPFSGTPYRTENNAPFDMESDDGSTQKLADPLDTTLLTDGLHTIAARIRTDTGDFIEVSYEVDVQNGGP